MGVPGQVQSFPSRAVSVGPTANAGNGASVGAGDSAELPSTDLFESLTAAFVPAFCDGLRVDLAAEGASRSTATYPHIARDSDLSDSRPHGGGQVAPSRSPGRIVISVRTEPMAGELPIAGTIVCTWRDPSRPTDADAVVARLVADQAAATLRLDILGSALRRQLLRTANLEEAVATNREIGQAIGILMATDHLTAAQAFERLRKVSQQSHRKLREVAADVAETGALVVPADFARAQSG